MPRYYNTTEKANQENASRMSTPVFVCIPATWRDLADNNMSSQKGG